MREPNDRKNPKLVIFVDDWASSAYVDGLSHRMELAFLRLLMRQAQFGTAGLPYEGEPVEHRNGGQTTAQMTVKQALIRASKCTSKHWPELLRLLDDQFPVCDDGRRRNAKLHKQLEWREAKSERQSEKGRKGGRPRSEEKAGAFDSPKAPPHSAIRIQEKNSPTPSDEGKEVEPDREQSKPKPPYVAEAPESAFDQDAGDRLEADVDAICDAYRLQVSRKKDGRLVDAKPELRRLIVRGEFDRTEALGAIRLMAAAAHEARQGFPECRTPFLRTRLLDGSFLAHVAEFRRFRDRKPPAPPGGGRVAERPEPHAGSPEPRRGEARAAYGAAGA